MIRSPQSPTYLVKNPYSYCFRMRVPSDIQKYLCRKELRYSLKTGYLSEAKFKARVLAGSVQLLFRRLKELKLMKLTDEKIQRIALDYLEQQVKKLPREISEIKEKDTGYKLMHEWFYHGSDDEPGYTLRTLTSKIKRFRFDLASGNHEVVEAELPKLLSDNGIDFSNVDQNDPSYLQLCQEILSAKVRAMENYKARIEGKAPHDVLASAMDTAVGGVLSPDGQSTSHDAIQDQSKKISEVIPLFIDEKKVNWTDKYEGDMVSSLKLFVEFIGDVPIQSVDRAMVADYKAALKKLPPRFNIKPEYRGKSVLDLIAIPHKETLSSVRINKYLQRLGQLFKYAIIHGIYDGLNPATEMQLPEDKWATAKRAAFTDDELNLLFRSDEYLNDSFKFHYQFWLPIIALFHGMRQNEIAGLFIEDIKEEDGVWYFDLFSRKSNPREAWRMVPIHPFLIEELNFLTYVQDIKKTGNEQLFPECTKTRDGYGKKVSRWFNGENKEDGGYKKKCGISSPDDRMRDFHSFRETFITRLRHKKVHDRELKSVIGHSINIDTTDSYTEPYPVKQLRDEIIIEAKFHEWLGLPHLKNSKYVPK